MVGERKGVNEQGGECGLKRRLREKEKIKFIFFSRFIFSFLSFHPRALVLSNDPRRTPNLSNITSEQEKEEGGGGGEGTGKGEKGRRQR